jgi:hypothetical protein
MNFPELYVLFNACILCFQVIAPVTAAESAAGPAVPKAEVGRKIEPKVAEPIGSESRARDDVDASQARSQVFIIVFL